MSPMSFDFVEYLNDYTKLKLKNLYGNYYPEIIDYEMKQIANDINETYIRRFGYSINEFNRRLFDDGIYIDSTPTGYLYGNEITQTWEWACAVTYNDDEKMKYLIENQKIEEAKHKALFIEDNIDKLIINEMMNKRLKSLHRKQMIEKETCFGYINMKKICGYDWL